MTHHEAVAVPAMVVESGARPLGGADARAFDRFALASARETPNPVVWTGSVHGPASTGELAVCSNSEVHHRSLYPKVEITSDASALD